jgi:hypothetical protein
MNYKNDYLSEFESEFELDNFSSEYQEETDFSQELEDEAENDFYRESNQEFETQDEYELSDEYGSSDEYELNDEYEPDNEQADSELENYLQEFSSPDQEFEARLYSALVGDHESSFEMEQEIDRVLHEMEVEYFWKSAKKFWNKHKNKLMPLAKQLIPGGTIGSLAKLAGGNLRGLLKNDLLKKALTLGANAVAPGVGGAVAGSLLNSETPNLPHPQNQAAQAVNIAKDAYLNMAKALPNLRPGNLPDQIRRFSHRSLGLAKRRHSISKGKKKQIIRIRPGTTVVVRPDRIIIYS